MPEEERRKQKASGGRYPGMKVELLNNFLKTAASVLLMKEKVAVGGLKAV